jgi:two-component system cell cycle sensor histidine kinase/response regulator CckA
MVCFPAAAATAAAPALPELPSLDGLRGQERVLVVEDDLMVRQTTRRILIEFGYEVVEAPDGDAALRLLDTMATPDVVITDLVMPSLDGVELSARLRQRWPQLPVILVSGYTNRPESVRQASSHITRYLSKPFSPTELLQLVRGMLDAEEVATA